MDDVVYLQKRSDFMVPHGEGTPQFVILQGGATCG